MQNTFLKKNQTKNQIKLIVFDIDGTLLDTSDGIISSVKYALRVNHLSLAENFDYNVFIGPPVQNTIAKLFPELKQAEIDELSLCFRNHYKKFGLTKAVPYPDVYATLDFLKKSGFFLAVATYKREDYAAKILDIFGLTKYISNIHGQDFGGKKSKTHILGECLKEANVSVYNSVMIGDTESDGFAASELGVSFIEVLYGFGFSKSKHFLGNKIFSISSFKELLSLTRK